MKTISKNNCCDNNKFKDSFVISSIITPIGFIPIISSDWSLKDKLGQIRCRLGSFRDSYRISPGIYAIGSPNKESDIFVSANYKLSFDILRRSLGDMNVWILVLDTKGINIWCAAGKGTFGTGELCLRIKKTNIEKIVGHKRIILPQLGAVGVSAHEVEKQTGFRITYGPIKASDIKTFINLGYKCSMKMRTIKFPLKDRAVLIPMEITN